MYDLLLPENIHRLIISNSPVAIGISGGKDSDVAAIATDRLLDQLGHSGPRVLIHSDRGQIEWKASLPHCQRLASFLGRELVVVKRDAGGMVERWETRWENNLRRLHELGVHTTDPPVVNCRHAILHLGVEIGDNRSRVS